MRLMEWQDALREGAASVVLADPIYRRAEEGGREKEAGRYARSVRLRAGRSRVA